MTEFSSLLQGGVANAWVFMPSAILLGALHGLEPGHSKTMMAAFIVAIRGTVAQAALLGLAATVSHTAIVWLVALPGAYFGGHWEAEASEPYFQLASGVLILLIAAWMLVRTWRQQHSHEHGHNHDHVRKPTEQIIDTGHGILGVDLLKVGSEWRLRIHSRSRKALAGFAPADFRMEIRRPDGTIQGIDFIEREGVFQSVQEIAHTHDFGARLILSHGHHHHDFDLEFTDQDHPPEQQGTPGLGLVDSGAMDPHARAHANDIRRRFANRQITTGQIILFGLTGGLIPCSAAIAVLLMCLQLKQVVLGAVLVLCFSIGLALTLILSGAIAALGVRQVTRRWSNFDQFARRAPYFSGILVILVGLYIGYHGLRGILG